MLISFINEGKNTAERIVEAKAVLAYKVLYDLEDLSLSIKVILLSISV